MFKSLGLFKYYTYCIFFSPETSFKDYWRTWVFFLCFDYVALECVISGRSDEKKVSTLLTRFLICSLIEITLVLNSLNIFMLTSLKYCLLNPLSGSPQSQLLFIAFFLCVGQTFLLLADLRFFWLKAHQLNDTLLQLYNLFCSVEDQFLLLLY
jgi:hypothetical protein